MKLIPRIILTAVTCAGAFFARAQYAQQPPGPSFAGSMGKIFGDNPNFTGTMEMKSKMGLTAEAMTVIGRISSLEGKTRFEVDMGQAKGPNVPPQAAAQMKAMGMDKTIMISRPDKKVIDLIYPGLQAYVEMPMTDPEASRPASDYKMELTELGKETVAGHPCVKNQAVITDAQGNKHAATIWNATDLKDFPVKIEQQENNNVGIMTFNEIVLTKPDASLFDTPANFTRYPDFQTMMQQTMMKKYGAGAGRAPGPPPPQ